MATAVLLIIGVGGLAGLLRLHFEVLTLIRGSGAKGWLRPVMTLAFVGAISLWLAFVLDTGDKLNPGVE